MKKLLEGLSLFQRLAYPRHRELFERLARNQTPSVVFVACADSRVVPNLLLQAEPGDLFIVRNAGNIVPAAAQGGEGVVASIEYAVEALGIRDIVVCGHSNSIGRAVASSRSASRPRGRQTSRRSWPRWKRKKSSGGSSDRGGPTPAR